MTASRAARRRLARGIELGVGIRFGQGLRVQGCVGWLTKTPYGVGCDERQIPHGEPPSPARRRGRRATARGVEAAFEAASGRVVVGRLRGGACLRGGAESFEARNEEPRAVLRRPGALVVRSRLERAVWLRSGRLMAGVA